jgi:hypothetical protein
VDQHDAYAIARWLRRRSLNDRYLDPAMTERDREAANLEGWHLRLWLRRLQERAFRKEPRHAG